MPVECWKLLTEEQVEQIKSGAIKMDVNSSGRYVACKGWRKGIGSSPRQAIEAI